MLSEGRYRTQKYFRYFLHLFSVSSFILSKKRLPSNNSLKLFIIVIQRMVSLMVILFSTKCFLFFYMCIDLSKPINYLKIVMLTSPGFFFNGWLVVLGFSATLTAKVKSWRSVTHMCFLAFSHQY